MVISRNSARRRLNTKVAILKANFKTREVFRGSRPRENAEAKMAVRILFPSPENRSSNQLWNFSTLFAVLFSNGGLQSKWTSYRIHPGLIEENDSSDFSSVHVFTQPGSKAALTFPPVGHGRNGCSRIQKLQFATACLQWRR
jgi:hypothetical protein